MGRGTRRLNVDFYITRDERVFAVMRDNFSSAWMVVIIVVIRGRFLRLSRSTFVCPFPCLFLRFQGWELSRGDLLKSSCERDVLMALPSSNPSCTFSAITLVVWSSVIISFLLVVNTTCDQVTFTSGFGSKMGVNVLRVTRSKGMIHGEDRESESRIPEETGICNSWARVSAEIEAERYTYLAHPLSCELQIRLRR